MKDLILIARPDHWFKNVFMIPGILLVLFFHPDYLSQVAWLHVVLGFVAACLVASANYVLNELLDAETDRHHPTKSTRPLASGRVRVRTAWLEWVVLSVLGLGLAWSLGPRFLVSTSLLWIMALAYNVPPVRLKDRAYGDVVSESVNNPIRMAMGWYSTGFSSFPTLSVLLAYWMFGAFLMAAKRLAEYRMIGDTDTAGRYRKSFRTYSETSLLSSILFYVTLFGMFSGVFMTRYRMELLVATPVLGLFMARYLSLAFQANSPVQHPESLYRVRSLMVLTVLAFAVCAALLFVDIPWLSRFFAPDTLPPP